MLPVGERTYLEHLLDEIFREVAPPSTSQVHVLPVFHEEINYRERLASYRDGNAVAVVPLSDADRRLEQYEASDELLIVDPARWPLQGLPPLAGLSQARVGPVLPVFLTARHSADFRGVSERVQQDDTGNIRRICRYYDGVTDLRTAGIIFGILPASVVHGLKLTGLSDLRNALVVRGIATRDILAPTDVVAVTTEDGLLALNERVLTESRPRRLPPGFSQPRPGIVAGPRVRIHPSARLYGPVVLHADVVLEENTIVIGPAVVGAGCRLGARAVVSQAVLLEETTLESDASLTNGVVGGCHGKGQERLRNRVGFGAAPGLSTPIQDTHPDDRTSVITGRRFGLVLKHTLDFLAALMGLIVLSPLLFVTALLVKLTSRGPVLYAHAREGKHGRAFRCFKFRTMVFDAHRKQRALYQANAVDGPQFKLERDPRVTRIGRWLRVTNIDELPQLVNVLRGEMSLIGPRPSPFRENQICVPWRQARLSVRPGITGLFQVCRHERWQGDFHQWIYFDTLYVRRWSLALDFKILVSTILTLGGRWRVPVTWLVKPKLIGGDSENEVSSTVLTAPRGVAKPEEAKAKVSPPLC